MLLFRSQVHSGQSHLGTTAVCGSSRKCPQNCRGWKFYPHFFARIKTAKAGSSTVGLQNCRPWKFYGRFSVITGRCSQNCRPWKFYGHFRVITPSTKLKMLQNCQPRQFYGHFCVLPLELQTSAVLRSVFSDAKHLVGELQTLEVLRSLFCDDKNWPQNFQPQQFYGHCQRTADLGSFTVAFQ